MIQGDTDLPGGQVGDVTLAKHHHTWESAMWFRALWEEERAVAGHDISLGIQQDATGGRHHYV
jgi:hypothetical protein